MNSESQNPSAKVFFPNLDGLRTIAFLFVYIQHGLWGSFETLGISNSSLLGRVIYNVTNGGAGVSIFFVLSGFLITYLLLTERLVKGTIHVWFFYLRRVLRIWPLYFAVILFSFVVYPFLKSLIGMDSHLASNPLYYFTFLSNFDVINIQKFHAGSDAMMQGITWSVAIEEQFYLVWPLLFLFTPKRLFAAVFLSVILISLLFRMTHHNDNVVLYFHSLSVCADLAVGGLCAYLSLFSSSFRHILGRINKKLILTVYLAGFAWLLYGSNLMNSLTGSILFRLISTFFYAFVILEQNFSVHSFYKFSKSKLLTYWGKYTYGLYLLHPIALLGLDIAFRLVHISYKNSFLLSFSIGLAGLCLSLLMSYLSYEYFEKWFLLFKDKFSFVRRQTKILGHTDVQLKKEETLAADRVA